MLIAQLRLFLTALMFLTRIPCPRWVSHKPESLARAASYFPAVGLLVGGIGAAVYGLMVQAYAANVAALFGIAATVVITGAFHEDAFADVCDGFGGWTPERRLEIMRDSRVGSYGVVGLVLLIGIKGMLLGGMPVSRALIAFMVGHTVGRWASVLLIVRYPYVTDAASLARPLAGGVSRSGFLVATLTALLVSLLAGPATAILIMVATLLLCLAAGRFFRRWIGGISGDCLGAVNQLAELLCYLLIAKSALLETSARHLHL